MFHTYKHVSATFYVVEHNPELFGVYSLVTKRNVLGEIREYRNFVGEASSKEAAHRLGERMLELTRDKASN